MAEATILTSGILKELLKDAMLYRGTAECIEDCVTWGMWRLLPSSTTTQTPPRSGWNFGILEVMVRDGDVVQRLTHIDGYGIYQRVRRNGEWKDWYSISLSKAP